MENALATSVQIPSGFPIRSLLEMYGNDPGTPWVNSMTLIYEIRIERQWKMLLRLPLPILAGFTISSLLGIY